MTDRELMQQALNALDSDNPDIQLRAATALRARLAQQEPLPEKSKGALSNEENKRHNKMILDKFYEENAHLYTAPPQRDEAPAKAVEWQGLTEDDALQLLPVMPYEYEVDVEMILEFASAIEAKLKEKNGTS